MGCVSRKRNKESSRWSCAIKEKVCPFPFLKRLCFYCRFIFQLVYSFNLFFLLRIYIYIYIYILISCFKSYYLHAPKTTSFLQNRLFNINNRPVQYNLQHQQPELVSLPLSVTVSFFFLFLCLFPCNYLFSLYGSAYDILSA
jgi:hypothetical protein